MEISFDNVIYKSGGKKILKDIDFNVLSNSITGIVGSSNSGKSTFLKLAGVLKLPSSGSITIDNYKITNSTKPRDIFRLRRDIGIVYQNPSKYFFTDSVGEEIGFALKNRYFEDDDKRIKDALKMVGLNDSYLSRSLFELSSGEQRLVSIAVVLAFNPKIILLDEPTMDLDMKNRMKVIKLLRMMKNRYKKTIVIASSDMDMLHMLCDDICVLFDGKIVSSGNKYDVFSNYLLLKKYDITVPKIVKFSYLVKEKKGINIGVRDDINDLIKDVYRYVK